MPKLRCVSYKDEFSADGCSFHDLQLGVEHGVVGCNSKVFGSSRTGDYVIITANRGKRRYFTIGILQEPLVECFVWKHSGGHVWLYNFTYAPLLPDICEITNDIKARVASLCEKHLVDPRYFFHPRFCGERYIPILRDLIHHLRGGADGNSPITGMMACTKS